MVISDEDRRRFDVAYYQWGLEDFSREIDEGFPYLGTFKTGQPRLLAHLRELPRQDQERYSAALVKRFAPETVFCTSDPLTWEEKGIVSHYMALMRMPTEAELDINQRALSGDPGAVLNRKRFRAMLRDQLDKTFGKEPLRLPGRGEWRYRLKYGLWTVETDIDTGGRYHQLSYDHRIFLSERVRLKEAVSLLSWLGIAGQTSWSCVYDADAPSLSDCLGRLCAHFLDALPRLLDGLSP
jgi:hypothetical protein